jgi:hypothetical protein
MHIPNDSEDNCAADIESYLKQDNSINDAESAEQQDVSTVQNVPRLI